MKLAPDAISPLVPCAWGRNYMRLLTLARGKACAGTFRWSHARRSRFEFFDTKWWATPNHTQCPTIVL